MRKRALASRVGQGPHGRHDPRARRLVHFPPAPLGSAHPVFYCGDCHKPVCTDETIESVAAIFEKRGSNAWFEDDAAQLLPEGFVCPHCGGTHFTKETDTLDGWFDSGSTHYAAMQRDQGFWPADMYMEGGDQYRGWFQSSLLVAVGALGKGAPYKGMPHPRLDC